MEFLDCRILKVAECLDFFTVLTSNMTRKSLNFSWNHRCLIVRLEFALKVAIFVLFLVLSSISYPIRREFLGNFWILFKIIIKLQKLVLNHEVLIQKTLLLHSSASNCAINTTSRRENDVIDLFRSSSKSIIPPKSLQNI